MSVFRSFQPSKGDVSSSTAVKSSVQRSIRTKLLQQYPDTLGKEDGVLLEQIWPKKEPITLVKFSREHVSIIVLNKQPLFFQHFDGPYYPELHLLHKYPFLMPSVQVDRGAIRFVLGGANVMAPGLLTAGGKLPDREQALPAETAISIFAQDKELPLAVGLLRQGTEEIKEKRKGNVIDNLHTVGDDLWKVTAAGGF